MQLSIYQNSHQEYQKQIIQITDLCSRVSFWRGITFTAFIILSCAGYLQRSVLLYIAAAAAIAVFLILVRYHSRLEQKQHWLKNCQAVTSDYIARFYDDWKMSVQNGAHYLNDDFIEGSDLDIFGKASLYQYICTASTVWGQDQLAEWLSHPSQNADEIKNRQQAAAELAGKTDFTLRYEAAARNLRTISYGDAKKIWKDFFDSLAQNEHFTNIRRTAIRVFPFLTLACLLAALAGYRQQEAVSGFLLFAFLQLTAAFVCYQRNNRLLAPVYRLYQTIVPYQELLLLIEQETFTSPCLDGLQKKLLQTGCPSAALKELKKIAESVVVRHNLLALVLCNCLFLYDFHCTEKYVNWKKRYKHEIKTWLEAAGMIEAFISLAVIARIKEIYTLPQITAGTETPPVLSAVDIRHPLLKEAGTAGNDITLEHAACIITGSNMSGKTTFMRSVGVNLVLAYAGGFCTARSFCASLMEICTSMRTQDDVNEGISTFYAELLRIKKMIETSKKKLPMISFIDEIYKGTNSKDRIYAARETVKKLSQPHTLTLLTTHDFELCDLEKDDSIDAENYYFTEYYEHNQIQFDYKIRKGRCKTTNARYLLRMAGILETDESALTEHRDAADKTG